MGSADWMPRNLDKRVEIMFPVETPALKERVLHILQVQLDDTLKARILQPDGTYSRVDRRGKPLICAQDEFCKEAVQMAQKTRTTESERVFIPMEKPQES